MPGICLKGLKKTRYTWVRVLGVSAQNQTGHVSDTRKPSPPELNLLGYSVKKFAVKRLGSVAKCSEASSHNSKVSKQECIPLCTRRCRKFGPEYCI